MDDVMKLSERDEVHVLAIIRYLDKARSFIADMTAEAFENDEKTQMATAMAVAQAGEHVKKLSAQFRAMESETDWKAIAGMRDWLVHAYDEIDFMELFASVRSDSRTVLDALAKYVDTQQLQDPAPEISFDSIPMLNE